MDPQPEHWALLRKADVQSEDRLLCLDCVNVCIAISQAQGNILTQSPQKLEGDPKNVAEAFPHTGFKHRVCAEMIPLDS